MAEDKEEDVTPAYWKLNEEALDGTLKNSLSKRPQNCRKAYSGIMDVDCTVVFFLKSFLRCNLTMAGNKAETSRTNWNLIINKHKMRTTNGKLSA